ncbi:hypothetical protein Dimus_032488 [Dionaea muscipula]
MAETVLFVERWQPSYAISNCRICHEEEFESCRILEAPCACSGTVKFAHRECIQRWCDEKGDTTCEICLQRYEPGYIATPKKPQLREDEIVTIRGSIDLINRRSAEDVVAIAEDGLLQSEYTDYTDCSSAADRSASCCRTAALTLTVLLLVRHLLAVLTADGGGHYPFSLLTVLIFRICGIIVPMYIIMRVITAVQDSVRRHHHPRDSLDQNHQINGANEEQIHHRIDIPSHWTPS